MISTILAKIDFKGQWRGMLEFYVDEDEEKYESIQLYYCRCISVSEFYSR